MSNKIKKTLTLLSVFLLLSFIVLSPLQAHAAFGWFGFGKALEAIPYLIAVALVTVVLGFSSLLSWMAGALFGWISSPGFISFSYTQSDNNPVIKAGLEVTQPIANIMLVVVFIFSALAIALDLANYATKKTLIKLLFIALLINFTPVIIGLIVDAGNIVTFHFLKGAQGGVSDITGGIGGIANTGMDGLKGLFDNTEVKIEFVVKSLITAILNIVVAIVFFIFSGLFLTRYIMIWVLVVLSPLAFVFYILPATESLWKKWWDQLVQWTFIGIPCAFFLWLAVSTFGILRDTFKGQFPDTSAGQGGFVDGLFPYIVIIIFLFLGLTMGLQTGAMGANMAISATKGAGKWTGKRAGNVTSRAIPPKWKRGLEKGASAAMTPNWAKKGVAGKLLKTAGYATGYFPAVWAIRRGLGKTALKMTETDRGNIRKSEEKTKGTTAERKMSEIKDKNISPADKIGTLNNAIDEGQVKDLRDLGLSDSEITNIGKQALKTHPDEFKKIRNAFPHLAEAMGKGLPDEIKKDGGVLDFDGQLKLLGKKKDKINKELSKTTNQKDTDRLESDLEKIKREIEGIEGYYEKDKDGNDKVDKDGKKIRIQGKKEKYTYENGKPMPINAAIAAEITVNISPSQAEKLQWGEILKLPDEEREIIIHAICKEAGPEQISALARNHREAFTNKFMEWVNKLGGIDWFKLNNKRLADFLETNSAQALGLRAEEEKEEEKPKTTLDPTELIS